ncbi:30848_t:CDS:2 [Gigaspora margarita]|uniref:30848_t:CDS:1 n=1 Tax=Gigaspora margarita TaxID=4874 RepID=A0ABN7UHC8_GIGMA|nr:30848_t:CDS:2 [Gigaspora margarita]
MIDKYKEELIEYQNCKTYSIVKETLWYNLPETTTLICIIWCGGKHQILSDTTRLSPSSNDIKPCKSVTATIPR